MDSLIDCISEDNFSHRIGSLFIRLGGLAFDNDFLAAVADYIRNWEHAFGFLEKPRWENSHRNYCAQSCRDCSNKLETWAVLEGTAFPANSTWLVTCSLPIIFLLKDWQRWLQQPAAPLLREIMSTEIRLFSDSLLADGVLFPPSSQRQNNL